MTTFALTGIRITTDDGDSLPSEEKLIQLLHKEKPTTQGRFNEVFPFGTDKRLVALNDFKDQLWGT